MQLFEAMSNDLEITEITLMEIMDRNELTLL
jgi:hypothetical protein